MSAFHDVIEFHAMLGLTVGDFTAPDVRRDLAMRVRLILEETSELLDALNVTHSFKAVLEGKTEEWRGFSSEREPDAVAAADALTDIDYVVNGAAVTWGINLPEVHDEVHRSNMTKRGGARRDDGKLMKPTWYEPPRIAHVLEEAKGIGRLLNEMVERIRRRVK